MIFKTGQTNIVLSSNSSIFKSCYNVLKKNVPVTACFVSTAEPFPDIKLKIASCSRLHHINHVYLSSHSIPPQTCISEHNSKFCSS